VLEWTEKRIDAENVSVSVKATAATGVTDQVVPGTRDRAIEISTGAVGDDAVPKSDLAVDVDASRVPGNRGMGDGRYAIRPDAAGSSVAFRNPPARGLVVSNGAVLNS
jgi:hypothetical protein